MQLSNTFPSRCSSQAPEYLGLLSHCAAHLRRSLPRRSHLRGTTLYPQSFTVRDLWTTLNSCVAEELHTDDEGLRVLASALISSLEMQNFFYVVRWKEMASATDDDVCMFLFYEEEEQPPTGVFPGLTKCYSPTCEGSRPCYSPSCPHRNRPGSSSSSSYSPLPSKTIPSPFDVLKCYSPTCEPETGCYSFSCPHRRSNATHIVHRTSEESLSSSNGPRTPADRPCSPDLCEWEEPPEWIERPRRSLSSYLIDFPTDNFLIDFWIHTSGVRSDHVY